MWLFCFLISFPFSLFAQTPSPSLFIERAGDVGQFIQSLTSLGLIRTLDPSRFWESFWACQNSLLTMGVIKLNVQRLRPNQLNEASFPSGHTTMAFCGLPTLLDSPHVPFQAKIPLTSLAFFVGASRVESLYHHGTDVMGGILLSFFWFRVWKDLLPLFNDFGTIYTEIGPKSFSLTYIYP